MLDLKYIFTSLQNSIETNGQTVAFNELRTACNHLSQNSNLATLRDLHLVLPDHNLSLLDNEFDVNEVTAVILIAMLSFANEGLKPEAAIFIQSILDQSVSKWPNVEDKDWNWFAEEVLNDVNQALEKLEQKSVYYVITTRYQIGDVENKSFSLVAFDRPNFNLFNTQVECAQQLNKGHFTQTSSGVPCFDKNGFRTFVDLAPIEITESEYKFMKRHISIFYPKVSQDSLEPSVIEFIKHISALDKFA